MRVLFVRISKIAQTKSGDLFNEPQMHESKVKTNENILLLVETRMNSTRWAHAAQSITQIYYNL